MFFLFFGTRQRSQVLGSGIFACPFCRVQRPYEHRETRTWGHLFWVPLIPIGSPFESVRCTVCHGEWAPAVLTPPSPQDSRGDGPTPQDSPPSRPTTTQDV